VRWYGWEMVVAANERLIRAWWRCMSDFCPTWLVTQSVDDSVDE
jgi:hypothetical protein